MENYVAVGDVQIPLSDAYIFNELHLTDEAFIPLVNDFNLEVEVEDRRTERYPFRYKAKLNGIYITMISDCDNLFD